VFWHSGKARALQTAEVLAAYVGPGGLVVEHAGLGPKDDPQSILGRIDRTESDLAIVGHLPHLSRLAALLLLGKDRIEPVAFERGGVVAFEKSESGQWQICWVVKPTLLR
jgi:phosphohistidine phosphatase